MMKTSRLDNIANRQRKSFVRDVFFAACVAAAALVGMTSVAAAAHAVHTTSR